MDPTRLTLISSVGGLLLAALILGPVFIVAIVNHDGEDVSPLQEGSMSRPAAQEAFARGLKDEDAAFLNDRFEMRMEATADRDVPIMTAYVRLDPDTGDHQFSMVVHLKEIEEAYGLNNTADEENATFEEDLFGPWSQEDAKTFDSLDSFEIAFTRIGELHAMTYGPGLNFAWRDYNEQEDFSWFDVEVDESFDETAPLDPSLGGDELARFIDADESITVHEVEASEWEGVPSWKITTTVKEEDLEEEAVFHFRQDDMAPLAVDMHFEDPFGAWALSMLEDDELGLGVEDINVSELHMKMRFRYGDHIKIEPPEDPIRVPVSPVTDDERESDRIVRNLTQAHDQTVPLDDLELHLVVVQRGDIGEPFAGPKPSQTLGVLRLKDAHEIETDDHRLVYEDNDGDGRLTSGDRFYVETTDEQGVWSNDTHSVELLLYDTWAGELEGVPAPGLVWLVSLALLGAGAARRSQRAGSHATGQPK